MSYSNNSCTQKIRVNLVDTDATSYIHYTCVFRYFEATEHQLMRNLLGRDDWHKEWNIGLPRVHVEADYKIPLHFQDQIECTATLAKLGSSSLTYHYEIRRLKGPVCITGKVIAVTIGKDGSTIPLPEGFRQALENALQQ